jgi:hypothetical protein
VGELAVGAVDLAPLMEQPHDLGSLPGQQPMQRAATGPAVGQLVGGAAAKPSVGPHRAKLQHPAGGPELPTGRHGLLDQVQRPALVAASTLGGTRPGSPNAGFPPPAAA